MMGERTKANAMFHRIPSIAKKNSSVDPIVTQQAQRFLACGGHFSAFELLYIRRDLAKMEKEIPQLIQILEKLAAEVGATNPINPDKNETSIFGKRFRALSLASKPKAEVVDYTADNRACYLMLKGSMLKSLNKGEEAIACFKEVVQMENLLKEKYFVPYSLFELAECLYHNNNIKDAQETIKKCNNLSGYSWEDPLKVRLRVTMDQLKKGGVLDDDADSSSLSSSSSAITPSLSSSSSSLSSSSATVTTTTSTASMPVAENGADVNSATNSPSIEKASEAKALPPSVLVLPTPVEASS